jgi:hypothetical protein
MNKNYFGIVLFATSMLGAMILSSCNHDDYYYSEEKAEQAVNDNYAVAFEKAFGKVGPNVDWGFSSKKTNAPAFTRAGGVTFNTAITFPGNCDDSKFLEDVPTTGVAQLPQNGAGPGSYYIDADTHYDVVSTYGGAAKLYVKGTIDLSDGDGDKTATTWRFLPSNTSEIYLLKGSKLILGEASAYNFNVAAIYIGDGATLETASKLVLNNNTKVYTHKDGTIKVQDMEVNTTSVLYNSGTVKVTGTVSAESNTTDGVNNLSFIVNNGNFECADVVVNAGAVLNIFDWKVSGTTHINSNNSGWINNGQWTTKDYAYVGGSENVINNCLLKVANDFEMNISSVKGAFKINSEGGVLTTNFYGGRDSSTDAISGPFKIMMAPNAVFVVSEKAQFESGRGSIGDDYAYGIFGPSTGYAVFQAKNIVREPTLANTWGAVTYGGNLYVSAETHFAQGNDGMADHKFIFAQDGFSIDNNIYAEGFKSGKPNITIPKTECSPGFKGGDPLYRVIAEDLSATESGDFDFNDVVFDVVKAEGGKTTLRLICAGGTLPLKVMDQEVHGLFGEKTPNAQGLYKMYNTGAGPNVDPVEFTVDGTFTTPEQIKNIIIKVYKNGSWMELKATTGEAACKILVDDTFKPVVERRNIADENKKFTNYVQGTFVDDFWWK